MKHFSRRDFLLSTGSLLALSGFHGSVPFKQPPLKLSFSTLGCPDWTLQQVVDFAASNNYQAVEIRGIQRVLDLENSPHFDTPEHINKTKELFKRKNLSIISLGSSAEMSFKDPAVRTKNIDGAKKFIDIAQAVGSPYIRVFPNHFPKEQEKQETLDLIADGLKTLADHARGSNVTVLMETHGDLIKSDDVLQVMDHVNDAKTGLVWDIMNMWTIVPEEPAAMYSKLKKYIRHTHIKDLKKDGDQIHYKLMGEGDSPIFTAIDLLLKDGYHGYFSFEWEKLWHPELDAPEIAIAQYSKAMKEHVQNLKAKS